ncbi:hypothetical protein EIB18_09535 [Caulobacter vibrioides]|uniref:Uncharacterized protein n=1 Tax=Caulobacter vibrioides (strain ATCC 19089 / CIP 103742 / CB 15) TaxID=190650 RepID=Q9A7C9_CAUVC|nr:hypothetical protein CC_1794 [Caulobacter vibrioides CB15]ATC28671.1 hypothetical protein CA607_09880 [Caulobacter vibrioides]AZH12926.1 hypothetical protein EIB18_09535 [Caulobacter vibrioides]
MAAHGAPTSGFLLSGEGIAMTGRLSHRRADN